jgi:hypothetical protein
MRQCPTCGTTYTDETLRFCLSDGAPLNDFSGEQATVIRPGDESSEKTIAMHGGQTRVDIQQDAPRSPQPHPSPPSAGSGGLLKVLLVIFGLGLFIVLIALAGIIFYYNSRADEAANKGPDTKTPSASPASTKDESTELRDLIANLQKQLADQKNTNRPSGNPVSTPNIPTGTMTTSARANSPGDGFLALRSLPSAQTGDRLLKIPHGAALQIGACGPVERSVHPGRWCQARYNGYTGYVYDYYVIY